MNDLLWFIDPDRESDWGDHWVVLDDHDHIYVPRDAPHLLPLPAEGEGVPGVPRGVQRRPQETQVRREDGGGVEQAAGGVQSTCPVD